jgi:calcium/calmodulin-dependent protein kinase (CaM kinase) II
MKNSAHEEILSLTQQLLDAIATRDWETYQLLCDPSLTAFEPEARGHLVEGMEFHRFYFALEGSASPANTTIASPHVRLLGADVAVVSYIRLLQWVGDDQRPTTARFEETRLWQRQDGQWRHVHFHRSANS